MIHFEGVHTFPLPVAAVAAKLSDAGFLANCVPDAQITEATPGRSAGKIKPKLSFLTGSLTLNADRTAYDPGNSVTYQLVTKTIGASSTVTTRLEFKEVEGGKTAVHWTGDIVALTGLLKMVPQGLIEGSARKVIDEIWTELEKKLVSSGQ